jgi:hypothetical protein
MDISDVDVRESLRDGGRVVGRHLIDDDDLIDVVARVRQTLFQPLFLVEDDDVERDPGQRGILSSTLRTPARVLLPGHNRATGIPPAGFDAQSEKMAVVDTGVHATSTTTLRCLCPVTLVAVPSVLWTVGGWTRPVTRSAADRAWARDGPCSAFGRRRRVPGATASRCGRSSCGTRRRPSGRARHGRPDQFAAVPACGRSPTTSRASRC